MQDKHGNEIKTLIVNLNKHIHCEIKKRAAERDVTIRQWVEEAIMQKIRNEIELGFK